MRKKEILQRWNNLKPDQEIRPRPVPYKHEGSTFDQDGIRITGSKTRLQLSHSQSKDKKTGDLLDSFNCYVQVYERGREAIICNAILRQA